MIYNLASGFVRAVSLSELLRLSVGFRVYIVKSLHIPLRVGLIGGFVNVLYHLVPCYVIIVSYYSQPFCLDPK